MQTTFTIEEIRNYIKSQDSLGDVLYNLKAEKIIEANTIDNQEDEEIQGMGNGDSRMIL